MFDTLLQRADAFLASKGLVRVSDPGPWYNAKKDFWIFMAMPEGSETVGGLSASAITVSTDAVEFATPHPSSLIWDGVYFEDDEDDDLDEDEDEATPETPDETDEVSYTG